MRNRIILTAAQMAAAKAAVVVPWATLEGVPLADGTFALPPNVLTAHEFVDVRKVLKDLPIRHVAANEFKSPRARARADAEDARDRQNAANGRKP